MPEEGITHERGTYRKKFSKAQKYKVLQKVVLQMCQDILNLLDSQKKMLCDMHTIGTN